MSSEMNSGHAEPGAHPFDTATEPITVPPDNRVAGSEPTFPTGANPVDVTRPVIHRAALPDDGRSDVVCVNCGTQARGPRCPNCDHPHRVQDRFDADLGAVCLVTDRGVAHSRNEDAVAAAVLNDTAGRRAITILAVSDGVSSSPEPQVASATAVRTGVEACLSALAGDRTAEEATAAGLAAASEAVRNLAPTESDAPSCTYVSAIVLTDAAGRTTVTVANVGDSRAYWLTAGTVPPNTAPPTDRVVAGEPEGAVASRRLTVDDSWAQALVEAGAMDEEAAMADPRAHTLMRWLGADAGPQPWSASSIRTYHPTGSGVLLLCTDGLWNYLSDPAALARRATASPPAEAARELVDFAVVSGGNDNITVALAPIPPPGPAGQ
ncbi:PP2C family protein-serine/threonine phosphatase [Nocardia brevicatena]|uniref:PP2C family protein-serine/threonine phosphatase n=1 Tax=Nocardia brevicatena TaxID=37327 RepID=UPI000A30B6F8|nr:protein phosphatase 2C domain-containing protein [Nocardia brevicatena]